MLPHLTVSRELAEAVELALFATQRVIVITTEQPTKRRSTAIVRTDPPYEGVLSGGILEEPIAPGGRVRVGWWETTEDNHGFVADIWHPVAIGTVVEVTPCMMRGELAWEVTLTDLRGVS